MEWMLDIQLGRRNLPPAQRLAVMDKFKKKIQERAANKKSKDIAESNKRRSSNVLQMEKNEDKPRKIHTDKELAKMAGVGTGTVARFNKVMNSDDDDLKLLLKLIFVKEVLAILILLNLEDVLKSLREFMEYIKAMVLINMSKIRKFRIMQILSKKN